MEKNIEIKGEAKIICIARYMRVSTDNEGLGNQEYSLDKTIKRIKEDNPNIEYNITDYKDLAFSGKSTNRPAFINMMNDVKKNKVNIVMFTKLDRLARSLQDLLETASIFEYKEVRFMCTEQNIDTSTPVGRLTFQVMGAFAEFERNIIRERLGAGRARAEVLGTKSGKPCHRPKVKIDEDGVRYKFKQGMSMHSIAKQYNVSITPIRRILSQELEKNKLKEYEKLKEKYELKQ